MAIMYLSKENFTCRIVQISLYLSVLKQFTLLRTVECLTRDRVAVGSSLTGITVLCP